ncbi:MAG: hypothetical protein F6J98_01755 [Moorea sp. SIO4G2]|nr:hypothetical protein [Moorena sp. SIO4G2]
MTTYPFAVYDEKATELKVGVNVNLNETELVLSPLVLWSNVGDNPVIKDLRANIYLGSSFKPVLEPVKGEAEDNLTKTLRKTLSPVLRPSSRCRLLEERIEQVTWNFRLSN